MQHLGQETVLEKLEHPLLHFYAALTAEGGKVGDGFAGALTQRLKEQPIDWFALQVAKVSGSKSCILSDGGAVPAQVAAR